MSVRRTLPAIIACVVVGPACAGRHLAPAPPAPAAQQQDIDVSLFLIGDAGAPARPPTPEPVLVALRRAVGAAPSPVIVYLGDNVYPRGLPDASSPERREAERRLDEQLRVTRETGARTVFIPGNHDWGGGVPAVRRQQEFIRAKGGDLASLLPGDGCAGPSVVDVGATVRVIALDSQWWLQRVSAESPCTENTPELVLASLGRALRDAEGRVIVVVAHHPLRTAGPHGGHFGWEDHIFPLRAVKPWLVIPLPVIGSLYPLLRSSGISSQDVSSGAYRRMRAALDSTLASAPPLVFAAGHEHGLQVIAGGSARWVLVSGAGIYGHASRLATLDSTRYAHRASGFMRIDVLRDKRARLAVEQVDAAGHGSEAYSVWLQ